MLALSNKMNPARGLMALTLLLLGGGMPTSFTDQDTVIGAFERIVIDVQTAFILLVQLSISGGENHA